MKRTLILLGLVGALAAACSSDDTVPSPVSMPGMAHIHGLGINPADERLYVATHYGLFTLDAGRSPQRVGDLVQDFMGFTITGPNEFLASGHPDPADRQQPTNLGLIKSSDAGRSWEAQSLTGSADFHALEYRHGRVYGADSQSGMVTVSLEGREWLKGAEIGAFDFSVSPVNADEMLATTRQGLLRSTDGAKTFDAVSGAPALVLISWPDSGTLVGADGEGRLYISVDAGRTWQPRHALNDRPQALLAAGGDQLYIATETAIYESSDDGATVNVLTTVD